jgi:ParB/RepB/Spo0J family partition protein
VNAEEIFEIILGERRFRACQMLGLATIPAIVIEASDVDVVDRALSENLQRSDLSPVEIALGLRSLLALNPALTQDSLAARHKIVGGPSRISNLIRLLSLPEIVQAAMSEGKLTEGHGVALCSLEGHPEAQVALASRAVESELPVAQLRDMVREKRALIRQAEETVPMPLEEGQEEGQIAKAPKPAPSEPSKPAPSDAPRPAPKDDNGLKREQSDKQFQEAMAPDADVPPLSSLPTPAETPAPDAITTPVAPPSSSGRVTTSISAEDDDWLFEAGLTIDQALERARGAASAPAHGIELSEMSIKCIKAIADDFNSRNPEAQSSPSEVLEAVLKIRAKTAGINIETLAEIPL